MTGTTAKRKNKTFVEEHGRIAVLWALRLLCHLDGYLSLFPLRYEELRLLKAIGIEIHDEQISKQKLLSKLRKRLAKVENQKIARNGTVDKNVRALAPLLGLNGTESELVVFAVVEQNTEWMRTVTKHFDMRNYSTAAHTLAITLGLPELEVRNAFAPDQTLAATGILVLADEQYPYMDRLALNNVFAMKLVLPQPEPMVFLRHFFSPSPSPMLSEADYPHAREEWALVAGYLASVSKARRRGVNILMYGYPGTGKTEFVRAVCKALQLELNEVAAQNNHGKPLRSGDRLGAYFLAQRVLSKSDNRMILFDEAEDVFPSPAARFFGINAVDGASISKARMNQALVENPVPSVWLSNTVSHIDPAYLRRFDLVLEMPAPTRAVRKKILRRHFRNMPVTDIWLNQLSENENLMPAVIERAARVTRELQSTDTNIVQQYAERALRGMLEAMGSSLRPVANYADVIPYQMEYLNSDADLGSLVEGLKRRGQGRLCLYGPPGTGKTAFGRHLAKVLDRPLLQKRASDLLSMWVGESEKNIARMFRDAERENAVLLLDEADSFLQDRSGAQHSWQITQVNELLTQMEAFQGVFIASTNLMDSLDTASLRRFDFKIKFDYLRLEQRERLFLGCLEAVGLPVRRVPDGLRNRLNALDTLTPGDCAVLMRRAQMLGMPKSIEWVLSCLETECLAKADGKPRFIGFTVKD